jgi:flagellar hook assembly protein FlgD
MFTMGFTSLRLNFGEVRRFRVEWNQKDNDGRQVPPGSYRVEAILLLASPQGQREEIKASASFFIRAPRRFGVLF